MRNVHRIRIHRHLYYGVRPSSRRTNLIKIYVTKRKKCCYTYVLPLERQKQIERKNSPSFFRLFRRRIVYFLWSNAFTIILTLKLRILVFFLYKSISATEIPTYLSADVRTVRCVTVARKNPFAFLPFSPPFLCARARDFMLLYSSLPFLCRD